MTLPFVALLAGTLALEHLAVSQGPPQPGAAKAVGPECSGVLKLRAAFGNLQGQQRETALGLGYAVVAQDSGHDNAVNNDPQRNGTVTFGFDPQARVDFHAPVRRARNEPLLRRSRHRSV